VALEPLSLYLHIPFCSLKCAYCDFNSYAGLDDLVEPYCDALIDEIRLWGSIAGERPVPTIFFGGGTPSLLPLHQVERILEALHASFALESNTLAPGSLPLAPEVTLEANPGTVDLAYLQGLRAAGINRISFGVQSFHDDELAALDRIHCAEEAVQCYRWAREAGFERINLDLIYGLSDQPLNRWQQTLDRAIALGPDHLSLYALTIEEGTRLAYDIDHGRVPEPDGDAQAAMYEWACERTAAAGYEQYEISNWCLPGEECRHNLVYWRDGEWLGLGAGAHSHWSGLRFADVYSPKRYVELVKQAVDARVDGSEQPRELLKQMRQVTHLEEQTPEAAMSDAAILGLRLNEGLHVEAFEARYGASLDGTFGRALGDISDAGLIERLNGCWRLTARGRLLANEVFVRLLPP
jgi:oxygen-independent coproporphyrinogen-3 oxidase